MGQWENNRAASVGNRQGKKLWGKLNVGGKVNVNWKLKIFLKINEIFLRQWKYTHKYIHIYIYTKFEIKFVEYICGDYFLSKKENTPRVLVFALSQTISETSQKESEREKKRKKENELSRLDAILEGGLLFLWPIKKSNQISKHIHPTFHDFYPSFPERVGWKYGWKVCR